MCVHQQQVYFKLLQKHISVQKDKVLHRHVIWWDAPATLIRANKISHLTDICSISNITSLKTWAQLGKATVKAQVFCIN